MSLLVELRDLESLPGAERQARDFILRNAQDVVDMDIRTAAKRSYTSPATLVRLCKRVGAGGFGELKLRLSSEVQLFSRLNLAAMDATQIDPADSPDAIVGKLVTMTLLAIEETSTLLSVESLRRAAELIAGARRVDFYGVGASSLVAMDAVYKFMRVGRNVSHYQLQDRQYVQAVNSRPDHGAVVVSYGGETGFILRLVDVLKENGTPVIAITGGPPSTLSRKADIKHFGGESHLYEMLVVDILYAVCNSIDYEDTADAIRRTRISKDTFPD